MDDLLDPKDEELRKKKIHDDELDEAEFPEDDMDDDFIGGKAKKKPLDDDTESLDDLAEEEMDALDEDSYDDIDDRW